MKPRRWFQTPELLQWRMMVAYGDYPEDAGFAAFTMDLWPRKVYLTRPPGRVAGIGDYAMGSFRLPRNPVCQPVDTRQWWPPIHEKALDMMKLLDSITDTRYY